jgi:hypothetical protein
MELFERGNKADNIRKKIYIILREFIKLNDKERKKISIK